MADYRIQTVFEDGEKWYFAEIGEPGQAWKRIIGSARLTKNGVQEYIQKLKNPPPDLEIENQKLAKCVY